MNWPHLEENLDIDPGHQLCIMSGGTSGKPDKIWELRSGGYGFFVIPLDGPDTGYLSMIHGRANGIARELSPSNPVMTMADGTIVVSINPNEGDWLHKVSFDFDELDLDTDGLSWNEEVELGTTDLFINSDGGTTADSIEVKVTGTDPTDMDDEPAGRDLVYVTYHWSVQTDKAWDEFFVYSFAPKEPGQLLYDQQKARCDSGLGECDPTLTEWSANPGSVEKPSVHDILFRGFSVFGYFPELDRLIINVAGVWGRYYVALHPEREPEVLIGPKYLKGGPDALYMPTFVQPTAYGDYFVGLGFMDGWLNARNNSWIQGMGGSTGPAMFWDGITVNQQTDGMWEAVRYEGWGEPGDILMVELAGPDHGSIPLRSGPRGGFFYAWLEPAHLGDVWGMDVRPP